MELCLCGTPLCYLMPLEVFSWLSTQLTTSVAELLTYQAFDVADFGFGPSA